MLTLHVAEKPVEYSRHANEDQLWKKVIADLFSDLLLFFLPDLHAEVDFSKPVEFLQQELFKGIIDERKGLKRTDQLAKVHLKNGQEQWILVHTEIQTKDSDDFSKRMFEYFYRIYDQHNKKIVAIALITGPTQKFSNTFHYLYYGTELSYTFNKYNVNDFHEEELKASPKLFSKALLAAYYFNQTRKNADRRYHFKHYLLKEIAAMNNAAHPIEIGALFYFVDYLLKLPESLSKQFSNEYSIMIDKGETALVYFRDEDISPTIADVLEKKREQWVKQGIEQGIEQGIHQLVVRLIKSGVDDEVIADAANMTIAEIQEIKRKL